jgi:hypothetical protein
MGLRGLATPSTPGGWRPLPSGLALLHANIIVIGLPKPDLEAAELSQVRSSECVRVH